MKTLTKILNHVSLQELREFVLKQANDNEELQNAILIAFAERLQAENPYSEILRTELAHLYYDTDDIGRGEKGHIPIKALDLHLDKAEKSLEYERFGEAIFIAKACIKEYAELWQRQDPEMRIFLDPNYVIYLFDILRRVIEKTECETKALFEYCKKEITREKYIEPTFRDAFCDFMLVAAQEIKADEFVELQENFLAEEPAKSSKNAKKLLQRQITYYRETGQSEKADLIIEANLQIEKFRLEVIEKRIASRKYDEAKR